MGKKYAKKFIVDSFSEFHKTCDNPIWMNFIHFALFSKMVSVERNILFLVSPMIKYQILMNEWFDYSFHILQRFHRWSYQEITIAMLSSEQLVTALFFTAWGNLFLHKVLLKDKGGIGWMSLMSVSGILKMTKGPTAERDHLLYPIIPVLLV